jgi:hypothetical protein
MYERTTTVIDIWVYPDPSWSTMDLSGFRVEATDGEIGTVDEASTQIGTGDLVIHTGPWIFGRKVMLPVGVISGIDPDSRKVKVNLTKEQIRNAPEFHEERQFDKAYRQELGSYYANRPAGPDYGKDDRPR